MKKYQFIIFLCSIFLLGCIVKPEMWGDVKIVPYDLADYEYTNTYAYPCVREKLDTLNNRRYNDTISWRYNFIFEGNLKVDLLAIKNHVINFVDTFRYVQGCNCASLVNIYKTSLFTDKSEKGIDGNIKEDLLVNIHYFQDAPILIGINVSKYQVVYYNFRYYNQNKRIPKKGYYWLEK